MHIIFVVAGYRLGDNLEAVEPYADTFQKVVILGVLLVIAVFVVVRVRQLPRYPRRRRG